MVIYPKDMLFHGVLRPALVPRELEKHLGTEGAGPRYFSSLHLSQMPSWTHGGGDTPLSPPFTCPSILATLEDGLTDKADSEPSTPNSAREQTWSPGHVFMLAQSGARIPGG